MARGKQKSFIDYLNERLDETEIKRLQQAAEFEKEYFASLKQELNEAVRKYMEKNQISVRKMASILCCSEARVQRIIAGEHGFTMATIAHIGAAIRIKPHIVFEENKPDTICPKTIDFGRCDFEN